MIIVRLRGRWREEILATNWRWLLLPAWLIFRPLVWLRNLSFNLGWRTPQRLSVPVWSVGNLTAGGTGKTPLTRYLARWAIAHGLQPAIISRGYRAENAAENDEARTVSECPVICSPDRVAAGRQAIANGATCLIMDDGFQHRQLHRDLDLVMIDATRPWGAENGSTGATLPLGYLRENRTALFRADAIIISRDTLISPSSFSFLKNELMAFDKPLIRVEGRKASLQPLNYDRREFITDVTQLCGKNVVLVSGIGNPLGFERAALAFNWNVLSSLRFPDHHHYSKFDAQTILATANEKMAAIVLTNKDAVKLCVLIPPDSPIRVFILDVFSDILAEDQDVLEKLLTATLPVSKITNG